MRRFVVQGPLVALVALVTACGSPEVQPPVVQPSIGSVSPLPTASPSFVRPTPTPVPTFLAYRVKAGDTLNEIARTYETTTRSIAYWNRATHRSLDPESPTYDPNRIEIGWTLLIIPRAVVDDAEAPALPTASPSLAPSPILPPPPTPRADGASLLVSNGPRESRWVALTFDMAATVGTELAIVDWLIANDVRATIFASGSSLSGAPGGDVMRRTGAHPDLFTVGNLSWDDQSILGLPGSDIADRLTRTDAAVESITGRSTRPFFRPPAGMHDAASRAAVGAAGWPYTLMWDIDTLDSRPTSEGGPTAPDIEAKVLSRAQGGSIVLFHLGGQNTLAALPGIVAGIRERGLEPVTLAEMFLR